MQELPERLLFDVYWSFSEPVPESPAELIEDVCAYAEDMGAADPRARLLQSLPFSDVRLRYRHSVRPPGQDWQDVDDDVRVVSTRLARLTAADLLWELHVACAPTVGEGDKHFFEGFELESEGAGREPPAYRVVLGS